MYFDTLDMSMQLLQMHPRRHLSTDNPDAKLDKLPGELVLIICENLYSLADLYALMRTSRSLNKACSTSKAPLRPLFPPLNGRHLFPPHPYFLFSALAPHVADWAVHSAERMHRLRATLKRGEEHLLRLAVEVSRLTLADIRGVHATKAALLEPIARSISQGSQRGPAMLCCCDTEYDYFQTFSGSPNVYSNIEECMLTYVSYCGIIHHEVDAVRKSGSNPHDQLFLYRRIGREFLRYCTPQGHNWTEPYAWSENEFGILRPSHERAARRIIFDHELLWGSEPFAKLDAVLYHFWTRGELVSLPGSQHLPPWPAVRATSAELLSVSTRLWVFFRVVHHQGWATFQLLLPDGLEQARTRLEAIKQEILALSEEQAQRARDRYEDGEDWVSLITDFDCDSSMYVGVMP